MTFSERFQFQTLPGLTSAGSREAFEQTAKDVRILWEQEALDFAVEESAGYPYKVQLIGDFAWKAAVRRVGGDGLQFGDVIVLADVREALPRVDEAMETLFRARWNGATGKQREMLAALARLGGVDVKRGVLAEALSSPTKAISVPRQRLLDRGLIDANKHGHLSFTVPGFTQFVLDQVADE